MNVEKIPASTVIAAFRKPWFLFRLEKVISLPVLKSILNYDKITKPAAGMVNEPSYIAAGGTDHGYSKISVRDSASY